MADHGEAGAYVRLRPVIEAALRSFDAELLVVPGNHDDVALLREHLLGRERESGPLTRWCALAVFGSSDWTQACQMPATASSTKHSQAAADRGQPDVAQAVARLVRADERRRSSRRRLAARVAKTHGPCPWRDHPVIKEDGLHDRLKLLAQVAVACVCAASGP